uniref:Uncharacterized protein n=1 Tax=Caenorhabditis japonica TaxID=281687 RepID=A0A8R1ENG2_CAEJA
MIGDDILHHVTVKFCSKRFKNVFGKLRQVLGFALKTRKNICYLNVKVLPHPPYSPDLTPILDTGIPLDLFFSRTSSWKDVRRQKIPETYLDSSFNGIVLRERYRAVAHTLAVCGGPQW